MKAPVPANESERLAALHRYNILAFPPSAGQLLPTTGVNPHLL